MKKALITGGTGAIGSALCEAFSKAYEVIFTYNTNEKGAMELEKRLGARAVKCDISHREQVKALAEECGGCQVLINNAGISEIALFSDITPEKWDRMIDVNLTGAYNVTYAMLPYMIHNKDGAIINISSVWGVHGASCEVHYSAAKGALQAMTKALAKEVGPSGIRVNCVAPGVILTEMNTRMFDQDTLEALKEETPLETLGTTEDVANMIYFLASAEAGFITGQIIGVNGGMVI